MTPEQIKQERERVLALLEECECCGQTGVVCGGPCPECRRTPGEVALARAYLALLDAHLALHAQLAQAGEREKRLREVMDEHFPEWDDDRDQHAFEECMWQSDSAHAAALPAICAIRAALAQAGEG